MPAAAKAPKVTIKIPNAMIRPISRALGNRRAPARIDAAVVGDLHAVGLHGGVIAALTA